MGNFKQSATILNIYKNSQDCKVIGYYNFLIHKHDSKKIGKK